MDDASMKMKQSHSCALAPIEETRTQSLVPLAIQKKNKNKLARVLMIDTRVVFFLLWLAAKWWLDAGAPRVEL